MQKDPSNDQGVFLSTEVAGYGGEEFALIFPDTGLAGALVIAEAARDAVMQLDDFARAFPPWERSSASAAALPSCSERPTSAPSN